MKVTLLNTLLGTPNHLVYDGDILSWSSSVPSDSWVYPGEACKMSIELVAKSCGLKINGFESTPHGAAWREILKDSDDQVPWFYSLSKERFNTYLSDLLDQLWRLLNSEHDGYYMNELQVNRELLASLSTPLIDRDMARSFLSSATDKSRQDILKFLPKEGERARRSAYTQDNTLTGRLTITSGPNILTLKKKYRKMLKSEFKNGSVVQVDIVSLEPRIALCVAEKDDPADIYAHIRDEVFNGEITRSHAKISTLGCIYGMTPWTLSKKLPDTIDARDALMRVRDYFDIPYLERSLKTQFKENGFIKNMYGRKITSSDSIVNYFLQSSGADAALLSFNNMRNILNDKYDKFKFLYVIHDAILIDTDRVGIEILKEITSSGIHVPTIDKKFPVKIEKVDK